MGRLLRFEFRKLFRQPSFYICTGILAALTFLSIYSSYVVSRLLLDELGIAQTPSALSELAGMTARSQVTTALGGSNVTLILGIFVSLFVCSDYVEGTAKNIIGRGYSRTAWLTAKLTAVLTAALIMAAATLLVTFGAAFGFWGLGKGWEIMDGVRILVQLLLILAHAAFFALFSLLIRKSGGAVAFNILVPIAVTLTLTILGLLIFEETDTLSRWWLPSVLSTVAAEEEWKELRHCLLVGLIYLAGSAGLSYLLVSRRDI